MTDGMSTVAKQLCKEVLDYYSSELVYYKEYMPKPGDLNQVYYPYCKNTLDVPALLTWMLEQEDVNVTAQGVVNALYNKDKGTVVNALAALATTNSKAAEYAALM
jgi:hypothetical protein